MRVRGGVVLAVALMLPAAALAQTVEGSGRTVYQPSFYATFAPSTALDIVNRTPGFTLEDVDTSIRGFSQTAGNVVINGQRPSSKSDTIDVILSRIPASRVARVEIGAGDIFGSDFAGKPQVLNLVLTAGGGVAGTVEVAARREYTGKILPQGSASALMRSGSSTFNIAATLFNNTTGEEGSDVLRALPSGNQLEYRRKINKIREPNGSVSASWAYSGGANRTAHLNGRYGIDRFALTQNNDVFPAVGTVRNDYLTQRYDMNEWELGGDVTRPLAGGGLKLLALATRRHRDNDDVSLNRVLSNVTGGFAQQLKDQRDETVARLVWNRGDWFGFSVETGAEGVLNRLQSRVDLFSLASGGARTRIDLPVDDSTVKEWRGELFANAGRPLSPTLRADVGLTYETSKLTVRGDATAERNLNFLKPKATLDYRENGWHAQLSVARTVAQLRFEDFISAAELSNDRVNGGNADLVPQRAWEFLATLEHPILGDGLIKVEAGYQFISLVQDRVPTPEGFDAPGNLGDGKRWSLKTTWDVPVGSLGIKGGRLSGLISIVDTSVEDPYTRRDRLFSGFSRVYWESNWRQDLGRFAWGVSASNSSRRPNYRLNEVDTLYTEPFVTAFADYRPDATATLTVGLRNITNKGADRVRVFYAPNRTNPNPNSVEIRERNSHVTPYISFKKNFG